MASITKRNDTYRIRVSCGYNSEHKQIFKSMTYTPRPDMTKKQIEKELQRQATLFEEKCRNGMIMQGNLKFSEFAEKWFADYADKQLKKSTVSGYRQLIRRVNIAIGHIRIDKIQPHHLMEFYNNLAENGIREDITYKPNDKLNAVIKSKKLTNKKLSELSGVSIASIEGYRSGANAKKDRAESLSIALGSKLEELFDAVDKDRPLSPKTILHYHRLISSILNVAVQWQVIYANPCNRVKPPKTDKIEAKYLDDVQAKHLIELLDGEPLQDQVIIKLFIFTGMRRGELCGLEWSDVDFNSSTIHIRRNSLYLASEGVYNDTPKNTTSNRVIKVSQVAMDMLKEFQNVQKQERLKCGSKWVNSDRVFTAWNGAPINPSSVTAWFKTFINKTDLPHVSIHSLRHTNATLMIASGTPIKTVSSRLGHADVTTTGNIYTHAIRSADEAAAETLQDILNPVKNQRTSG